MIELKNSRLFVEANYIGGAWTASERRTAVVDPATGATLGSVPDAGAVETRAAIAAAHAAFPEWRAKTAGERAAILRRLAALVTENTEDLARILTAEQGKPLAEARSEVGSSAAYILWFAEEARRVYGDVVPSPWRDRRILVTRDAVGVVGAITPWNFPSSMIARKLGPALAAGCTMVLKPAPQTPLSGLAWSALCADAGVPAGVFNVVTGDARAIGGELTSSPLVKKITFTGSTAVGKLLLAQAAATVKKVSMELGGNAPFIVFDDADMARAVKGAVAAKYRNSGQTCVCTNRFLVQDGIYDAFARRMADAVGALKVGNGFDDGVENGPLINAAAVDKVERHLRDALAKGAKVIRGGHRHALGGTFFEPTVIIDATANMTIAKEETFGPIAPLFRFKDEADAIAMANDTEFGLASYFYTRDLGRTFRVSSALEYGMVGINEGLITTEVAPFGGVKQSGLGREGSYRGIEDYLDTKYLSIGGIDESSRPA
ncbi:MAG TPA: NAD-dependent succinate-semialdehyde dehydrogenase [Polyangia bacterium]|nr:NAD-dependent succinate-semialdehyde dehydrogenase [Polyangia bacterium]